MKPILLGALACAMLCGCAKPEVATTPKPAVPPGAEGSGPAAGITPVGPMAGGITPVTGELGGTTGGGVAQSLKERAKGTANAQSQPPAATEEDDSGD